MLPPKSVLPIFSRVVRETRINIHRGDSSTQIAYRNEGAEVAKNTIQKLRRELGLVMSQVVTILTFFIKNKGSRISAIHQQVTGRR